MKRTIIAVDAMGGDHGPKVIVPAALNVLAKQENLQLILVGDQDQLRQELRTHKAAESANMVIRHTSQQVEMDESPSQALRGKKDSSMRVAINLVKEGAAHACVSAGNTGALMATSHFVLKTLPGIDRPAIVSAFPTRNGKTMRMLDLGANVDCSPEDLFQFAVMGSVLTSALENIPQPKVALLNIGEEAIKGNDLVKKAAPLLAGSTVINYVGFVEGDSIYKGNADVVVCDGFIGNVALKTSEGVAVFIKEIIKAEFKRNWLTRLLVLFVLPVLKALTRRIDPDRYNGASFIGLQGIVIKSHGGASKRGFAHAIEEAVMEVDKDIPNRIREQVAQLLKLSAKN